MTVLLYTPALQRNPPGSCFDKRLNCKDVERKILIGDKMKKLTSIILVCMIAAVALAAEGQKQGEQVQKRAGFEQKERQSQPGRPMPARRGQAMDRQKMFEQMLARRADEHAKVIGELAAIKKIAEEEGAVRTVKAIDDLIAKKNAKFKEESAKYQKRRQQAEGRAGQSKPDAPKQGRGKKPEKSDQPKTETKTPAEE